MLSSDFRMFVLLMLVMSMVLIVMINEMMVIISVFWLSLKLFVDVLSEVIVDRMFWRL